MTTRMVNQYTNWLAIRYVFSKKDNRILSSISLISVLGIMTAVAVLIVVLSVVNGFEKELREKLLIMSGHAHVESPTEKLYPWKDYLSEFEENDRVISATPYINGQGVIASGQKISSTIVRGLDTKISGEAEEIENLMIEGTLKNLYQGSYSIILGNGLMEKLNTSVGEKVTINLSQGLSTPLGLFPRTKQLKVVGVFRSGMGEYDANLALIDLRDAQTVFRMGDSVSGVRLTVTDIYKSYEIVRELALSTGDQLLIDDWTQRHINFFRSIQVTKSILFIILLLIVAVAAFNIVSTLVMVVRDKRNDIAILRTIGMLPTTVIKIFIVQGSIIGITGTVLGVLLGVTIAVNLEQVVMFIENIFTIKVLASDVYFISDLPSEVRIADVMIIALIAIIMSILSTLYPAWSASRIIPSEVLRYD
ncbi:MAG: lipoprotein-releasing ABC transporter permease subunit [Woeseiaceae bacterium]|nr:lipoprotein-releasing ABC transporter permease subunit [Woeseiaceae bacterium]